MRSTMPSTGASAVLGSGAAGTGASAVGWLVGFLYLDGGVDLAGVGRELEQDAAVVEQRRGLADVHLGAVGVEEARLGLRTGRVAAQDAALGGGVRVALVRVNQVDRVAGDQRIGVVAGQLAECLVDAREAAVGLDRHADGGAVEDALVDGGVGGRGGVVVGARLLGGGAERVELAADSVQVGRRAARRRRGPPRGRR